MRSYDAYMMICVCVSVTRFLSKLKIATGSLNAIRYLSKQLTNCVFFTRIILYSILV
jgi:hypothetical protein